MAFKLKNPVDRIIIQACFFVHIFIPVETSLFSLSFHPLLSPKLSGEINFSNVVRNLVFFFFFHIEALFHKFSVILLNFCCLHYFGFLHKWIYVQLSSN